MNPKYRRVAGQLGFYFVRYVVTHNVPMSCDNRVWFDGRSLVVAREGCSADSSTTTKEEWNGCYSV